jgi:hypothetical protein
MRQREAEREQREQDERRKNWTEKQNLKLISSAIAID